MILGLGTGMLACQFRSSDEVSLVEIDKQVINIAKNPKLFTFLRDCPPSKKIIEQDGLIALKDADNHAYHILVMDAFQSDAIPIHLLTLEAFKTYLSKLKKGGVIAVNVSNRHLRILPVLTAAAHELSLIALKSSNPGNPSQGQLASEWVLLTENEETTRYLLNRGWKFVGDSEMYLWTNDYSNILPLIKQFS